MCGDMYEKCVTHRNTNCTWDVKKMFRAAVNAYTKHITFFSAHCIQKPNICCKNEVFNTICNVIKNAIAVAVLKFARKQLLIPLIVQTFKFSTSSGSPELLHGLPCWGLLRKLLVK